MKTKKTVYRTNDEIEIVEPLIVERVGYPLGLNEAYDIVEKELGKDVLALREKLDELALGPRPKVRGLRADMLIFDEIGHEGKWDKVRDDPIVRDLARHYVKLKKFGGPQRSIHTKPEESLRGKRATVVGKRCVKTGTYSPGSTRYDWDGIPDFDPAYLEDEKTHVLLEISVRREGFLGSIEDTYEIEECHVRKTVDAIEAERQNQRELAETLLDAEIYYQRGGHASVSA